jgi:hypothetical protein
MPKVDPTQYLMEALSILTGGLITDMQTLILGLVVCAFLLMALDILKDLLILPALEAAANFLANPSQSMGNRKINKRFENWANSDGPLPLQDSGGVEISEERFASLESAMDEAAYNERMKNRLSDDEADELVRFHGDRLR